MRDGPARGRRPVLRRPANEGLRRGLGARSARGRAHRLPRRCRGRSSGRARTSTRRSSRFAAGRCPTDSPTSSAWSRRPSPTAARRSRTRSSSPASPPARSAQEALAALGRARGHARRGARAGRLRRARAAAAMTERLAHAKINLALVVGPVGASGKHELTTVFQRVGLADRLELEPADGARRRGLRGRLARPRRARGARRGSGGRARVARPDREGDPRRRRARRRELGRRRRARARERDARPSRSRPIGCTTLAARLGADVPFFLATGPQLGEGDGSPAHSAGDPAGPHRRPGHSRRRGQGVDRVGVPGVRRAERRRRLRGAPRGPSGRAGRRRPRRAAAERPRELAARRPSSRSSARFRADVSGAGPAVYGLFADEAAAAEAVRALGPHGWAWIGPEAW